MDQKNAIKDTAKFCDGIKPSITMKITALANELRAEGKDVIGLSAGEPDADTPDNIKQAGIRAITEGKTKYTPASGIIELKRAICDKLKQDNQCEYTPKNIVISCGAKHAIFNALTALLNPEDEVIIPAPYWVSYPDQVRLLGAKPNIINTTEKTNFKITPDILKKAISYKSKVLILNSPSNPTGMIYTKSEIEDIAEIAIKNNLYILSDEIYEKLIYDGSHFSIASISNEVKEKSIIINGVSKSYSMTGWRIGYSAANETITSIISKCQSHTTSNPCAAAQWASLEALTGPQTFISTMKEKFKFRRQLMIDLLNQIPGITCIMPEGAFYAFPNIASLFGKKSNAGTITDDLSFCEYLLQEENVACVPGTGFGAPECIRLSYATSEENIKKALTRMKNWINTLK